MRMGLYYSGGYDWTFVPGPIRTAADYQTVKPQSEEYGKYAFAQIHELIARYHPAVLWNDIDWPKTGNALQVEADYYNAIPDGVIDDRFGIKHADFKSPEYQKLDKISEKKWEECRGLGRSFGYNRAEGEAETIPPAELISLLVDIVSKNGNLLLDVGPEADGTIPPVQMETAEGARVRGSSKTAKPFTYDALDAGGREVSRGRRPALYSQGKRPVRHGAGKAEGTDHHAARCAGEAGRKDHTAWRFH